MNTETNNNNRNNSTNNISLADSKLNEFFTLQLQDILWAEKKLIKILPKWEEAASSQELKNAFSSHLKETKSQIQRLEKVFSLIGEEAKAAKCLAMAGIAEEGEGIIDETDKNSAQRDVGLIFAAQKAEHYEIATYGGLVRLAKTLGYDDAAQLLHATLQEEKNADENLTRIAEKNVNKKASREPVEA